MPPSDPETGRWFEAELQPHEAMLRAWLKSNFRDSPSDIDDIVQEAMARVLKTRTETGIRSPKAYLFVIARNLALMRLRRSVVENTTSLAEIDCSGLLDETADVPQAVARSQELEMLTNAVHSLPKRCRQVLTLRKIYGLSIRDTARELGMVEHTVVIQTAIGIQKIGRYFKEHGISSRP